MKRIIGAAFVIAAFQCEPAIATIIDFEGLSPGPIGAAYSEDGFTLQATRSFLASNSSGSISLQGPNPFDFSSSPRFALSRVGGGEFILRSMLIFAADMNGLGVPLSFTGQRSDGSTVGHTVNLPEYGSAPIPATRTLVILPDSFHAVLSVSWQNGAEFHQFDDIDVSPAAVPEPPAWASIIFGLGCLGLWRSKRRAARDCRNASQRGRAPQFN